MYIQKCTWIRNAELPQAGERQYEAFHDAGRACGGRRREGGADNGCSCELCCKPGFQLLGVFVISSAYHGFTGMGNFIKTDILGHM